MQKSIIRLFYETARQYPWRVYGAIANSSFTSLVGSFAGPLIIAVVLENIQAGTISLEGSLWLIGLFALTQLFGEIIGWRLTIYLAWTFESAAQRDLHGKIFKKLTEASLGFHANRFGGSLVSQTNKLIGAFERFWDTVIFQFTPVITSIIAATTILSFIFWQYAVVLFVVSIIFGSVVLYGSKRMVRFNEAEATASNKNTGRLADMITNIMAVKSFGKENHEQQDYVNTYVSPWRERSLETMRNFLLVSTGYSTIIAVLNLSALVAAIWAVEQAMISIAVVYLCVTYTFTVARQLWEMNSIMRNYNRVMGDAREMAEILSLENTVVDKPDARSLNVSRGDILFDDVSFRHSKNEPLLFDGFQAHIKPGEKIGLIGPSGGGKSSLTKLLLRFSDINDGTISIDGHNIADVTQQSLRESIAYVPQEPLMFHRSVAENIAYSDPSATMQHITAVAKMAHAHDFITGLEHGYDTLVGERGVKLSGGQKQRVAIARAILKNAPILVLDEATSALDSESETLIQKALQTLMQDRTSIVIAHRLSTIQKMDRILVLKDGAIVEQGTHKELIRQNGLYATLWSHQSGGFLDN